MRLLRINDINVDIDEKTAIGIDLQSYNIKEPGKTFINVSNTFTIPLTTNNLNIFGLADDPQSLSTQVYDVNICNYWIDNEKIIDNAKVRVEEIHERISLFIYEKNDFWNETKKDLWPDFMDEMLAWLNTEKGLPIQSAPYTGSTSSFLTPYISATSGVLLPFYFSNLSSYISVGQQKIEYQTVDSSASGSIDITVIIDSFVIDRTPWTIPISYVSSGQTPSQIAARIATEINASSNKSITQFYDVTSDNEKVVFTSKEGIFDPDLNIEFQSSDIPNKPTSTTQQDGVSKGLEFVEYVYSPGGVITGEISLRQKTLEENSQGGHFCIYAKTIFEFIEYKYNVNLLVSGGVLPGNIWDDVIASKLYISVRDLSVFMSSTQSYFLLDRDSSFLPHKDQKDKADKRVYDFIVSFMNHMNVVKDELFVGGEKIIRFARFDDVENAEVLDFSERISGKAKFSPKIDGYAQNNYIKFKEVFPEGDELLNSKSLTCNNVNIDVNTDLLEIDAYVPGVIDANSESISNASDKESFKTFTWYISDTSTALLVRIKYFDFTTSPQTIISVTYNMQIAELYDLNSEYNFLDEIITYPKVYEVDKWLTISDIRNFEFFKQYHIKELNGSFFVNKIKGFNPEKSNKPTTIELIKVSNRTPVYPPDLDYWTDGVGDGFTDGINDYYF